MALSRPGEAFVPARARGPLTTWLLRHASTAVAALGRLARQPFASLMTLLVIAVTLALPAAMHVVIKNARSVSGGWASALDFSVYLVPGTSTAAAKDLVALLEQRADIESVTFIPADEAFAEFKEQSGFGAALDHLPDNPLPHTLVVRPAGANTPESLALLQEEIANLPETDFVQADTAWVKRFHAILAILQRAIVIGAVLLGAAILVVIGNTIRLDIQNRREEIEVTKLIGASNAFVRRPFLWSGLWYGLGGGLLALALVAYGLYALRAPVQRLAGLYDSPYTLLSLDFRESLVIVGAGILLGLIGSWVAATRHMRRIEPR